ncbi:MAG TPA: hypothetical protein VKP58_00300, partial [Candidatus Acidoferrum sp.]|nr:hypothetical protein [Candidatus Acidoferrum sp.]
GKERREKKGGKRKEGKERREKKGGKRKEGKERREKKEDKRTGLKTGHYNGRDGGNSCEIMVKRENRS